MAAREQMGANVDQGVIARIMTGLRYAISGVGPENFFGPMQPLPPMAQDRSEGRRFDYPVGFNLRQRPRQDEATTFEQLRGLADAYDLMRLAIETRKDQLESFQWEIVPKNRNVPAETFAEEIKRATEFFERPDKEHDWPQWLRQILEELLVIDAVCIYPRESRGGTLYGLELVDASTVKRVLDDTGRTPLPPDPAYQQVLKGLPASDYTRDQMIYIMRNPRVWKVYGHSPVEQVLMTVNIAIRRQVSQLQHYCYSDDTEVMTRRGWKRFADTAADEEFATRQIGTGVFEWQRAYESYRADYTGQMIRFKGQRLDMLVTPNHRMLVNSLPVGVKAPEMSAGGEYVISAEQMAEFGTTNTGIPLASVWQGRSIPDQVFEDDDPRSKRIVMSGDDYCAFVGMYLAEGNLRKVGGIAISQPVDDKRGAHETYKTLLMRLFGSVTYSGHQFEVCAKAVVAHLQQFGKAWQKFVPALILEATHHQLEIFFHYYYLGDGAACASTKQCFTVSRALADHLTEIGQKLGYAPTVWTRKAGNGQIGDRHITAREGYMVSFAEAKATKGWQAEWVDYDGPIACVCVPNKFLYVRRNGKACWSGNTEGNIPEAIAQVPDGWTMQQIAEFQAWWDSLNEGNSAQKRKMRFIPKLDNIVFPKGDILKDEYDEWLARLICFAFSLSPSALMKQVNRATSESMADTAREEGVMPLLRFLESQFSMVLQKFVNFPGLKFAWKIVNEVDPSAQSAINKIYLDAKVFTPDEVRENLGKPPLSKEARASAFPEPVGPPQLDEDGKPIPPVGPDGKPLPPKLGPDGKPLPVPVPAQAPPKPNPFAKSDEMVKMLVDRLTERRDAAPQPITVNVAPAAITLGDTFVNVPPPKPTVVKVIGDTNINAPPGAIRKRIRARRDPDTGDLFGEIEEMVTSDDTARLVKVVAGVNADE